MNKEFKRILDLALRQANQDILEYQEKIIRKEKFGSMAVVYPDLYRPDDLEKCERNTRDLEEKYAELLDFTKRLSAFRQGEIDKMFDGAIDEMFNNIKTGKR